MGGQQRDAYEDDGLRCHELCPNLRSGILVLKGRRKKTSKYREGGYDRRLALSLVQISSSSVPEKRLFLPASITISARS